MDLEKFERLTANYRRNHPGDQTRSIWFDREVLEELLKMTEGKKGGIRCYFAEHDKDSAIDFAGEADYEQYVGKTTIILAASEDNAAPKESSQLRNGGTICPPGC